jgi:hypothetical protein
MVKQPALLWDEGKLRIYEKAILEGIFAQKKRKTIRGCRKINNE